MQLIFINGCLDLAARGGPRRAPVIGLWHEYTLLWGNPISLGHTYVQYIIVLHVLCPIRLDTTHLALEASAVREESDVALDRLLALGWELWGYIISKNRKYWEYPCRTHTNEIDFLTFLEGSIVVTPPIVRNKT